MQILKPSRRKLGCWLLVVALWPMAGLPAVEIWRLDNLGKIGGQTVTIEGAPRVTQVPGGKAVIFDGAHDGLFVPAIPIAGARQFTIEVLFSPAEGGLEAQRFFHVEDTVGTRALIEVRLNAKGAWWLDTYLHNEGPPRGLTLVDPKRVHSTDQWYWVALRYDGKRMAHFVNGEKEREGELAFLPLQQGQISIGVRQNKVFWFKGGIREVRFHTEAVAEMKLQRVP